MTDVCALGELLIDFTFSGMSEHGQRLLPLPKAHPPQNRSGVRTQGTDR